MIELVPGGEALKVTNENKMEYLDALAQYRLRTRVISEVDSFLEGLNEIIPDHLLCIFDENELEVLTRAKVLFPFNSSFFPLFSC